MFLDSRVLFKIKEEVFAICMNKIMVKFKIQNPIK